MVSTGLRLLALAMVCLAPLLRAQDAYEGKRISSIQFDPPEQPLPAPELYRLLPLKAGAVYHYRALRDCIQRLYSTGRFADVAVDAMETGPDLALKFITKRAYFIGRVTVSGVKEPPSSGQLISATKLSLGATYSDSATAQAVESIQNILRRNGFYEASVQSRTGFENATEQATVRFEVKTGKRARFEMPSITGHPEQEPSAIIHSTRWKRLYGLLGWSDVTDTRVQQGLDNIRNHYQKKELLLAKVSLAGLEYHDQTNRVMPVVNIEGGPLVTLRTEGFKIPKGKLKQLVPVYQERTVDNDLLVEGERNIQAYMETKGYFEAQVSFRQEHLKDKHEAITYVIDHGRRHVLVKLELKGYRYFDAGTIRERMLVMPVSFPRFPSGRYSQQLMAQDIVSIRDLYRTNGFREVKVEAHTDDDFQGKANHLAVIVSIEEGPQSFVASLSIQGVSAPDERQLRAILVSSQGQPFSELNVATDRDNILNYFYNHGYLNALFEYYVDASTEPGRVALRYSVTPGGQEFVRDILITGLNATRTRLVTDRITLQPGDPLAYSQVTDSQRKMYDLGIFARVNVAVQNPAGDEEKKYLLYQFDEARKYSFNFGVGAELGRIGGGDSLEAPAGKAGFSPRATFGISRINVWGLGQTVSLQTRISNIEQRIALTYLVPQFIGNPKLSLTFTTFYDSSHDIRTFSAIRREASVQLSEKVRRAYTIQYRLVYRRVTQGDLLIDPLLVPLLAQPARTGLAGVTFIQDKRDDPSDAHTGIYTTVDLGYAPGFLGSQTEFGRVLVRNSTYHRIGRSLVFARSTQFGEVYRTGGRPDIPLSERFFAGGSVSQRAFPDDQAGPRDLTTGFPLGGSALLMNNTELRFPLFGDNVGGVLFHDAGNVYDSLSDISFRFRQRNLQDFNYMVQSVGFGIRYRTPIGPVRIDLSFSPDAPRFFGKKGTLDDFIDHPDTVPSVVQKINGFQFHFSLGQAF